MEGRVRGGFTNYSGNYCGGFSPLLSCYVCCGGGFSPLFSCYGYWLSVTMTAA